MSLAARPSRICAASFPRVSGDEPERELAQRRAERFSPRERG